MWLYLENLTSRSTKRGCPWELNPAPPVEKICKDKDARQKWYHNPDTRHVFYCSYEGVNPNVRVSDENNAHVTRGFVVDIDHEHTEDRMMCFISGLAIKPCWLERSLGGKWRLLFRLWDGEFILMKDKEVIKEFLLRLRKEIGFDIIPGLDEGSWFNPNRTFCRGGEPMIPIADRPTLSSGFLQGLQMEAVRELVRQAGTPEIAIEQIEELIKKKWPEWSWPGEFKIGSQGPSWWVEGSTSPKSAIVKADGMYTWAAHAIKAFYSWEDLLGAGAIGRDIHRRIRAATKAYYFDGKYFFTPSKKEGFEDCTEAAMRRRLAVAGLSPDRCRKKGSATATISEIDMALHYVETEKRVEGAGPVLYRPSGIITFNGRQHLNTSKIKPLLPADGKQVWGSSGNFPFISNWYDRIFYPRVPQLSHFLSWVNIWYKDTLDGNPHQGQAVIAAGGPSIGKTLTAYHILGKLMGAAADASDFLKGSDQFGGELFGAPLWVVDDQTMNVSLHGIRLFTGNLKKAVANTMFKHKVKFKMPSDVLFDSARIIVFMNKDTYSMQMIPNTEESVLDKLCFYNLISNKDSDPEDQRLPKGFFPRDIEKILARELPFFARYVYDYQIPDEFIGESRFRITPYHDESMMMSAHHNSGSASIVELLWKFLDLHVATCDDKSISSWTGTASMLLSEMNAHVHLQPLLKNLSAQQLTRHLGALTDCPSLIITSHTNEAKLQVWTLRKRQ